MQRHLRSVGLVAILLIVAAIGSLAQSEAPKPATGVALDGYCPVAYVVMNQAMKGDPRHKSTHQGRTFHFANADAKKMFDQAPAKYVPAYDGLCATASPRA